MSWRRRAAAALLSLVCVLQMSAPCQCVTHLAEGSICCGDGTHIHLARTACRRAHAAGLPNETTFAGGRHSDPEHDLCPRCRGHLSPLLDRVEIDRAQANGPSRGFLLSCSRPPSVYGDVSRGSLHRVIIDDWIAGARPRWAQARLQI